MGFSKKKKKKDRSRNDIRRAAKLIVELRRVALVAMSAQSESQSSFKFLSLGAIIQSFDVSGKNIILNFPTEDYAKRNEPHFNPGCCMFSCIFAFLLAKRAYAIWFLFASGVNDLYRKEECVSRAGFLGRNLEQ